MILGVYFSRDWYSSRSWRQYYLSYFAGRGHADRGHRPKQYPSLVQKGMVCYRDILNCIVEVIHLWSHARKENGKSFIVHVCFCLAITGQIKKVGGDPRNGIRKKSLGCKDNKSAATGMAPMTTWWMILGFLSRATSSCCLCLWCCPSLCIEALLRRVVQVLGLVFAMCWRVCWVAFVGLVFVSVFARFFVN
jgi:hypothetical protein